MRWNLSLNDRTCHVFPQSKQSLQCWKSASANFHESCIKLRHSGLLETQTCGVLPNHECSWKHKVPTTTSTPSDDEVLGQVALCWWCWTCLSFWQKRLGDRWWGKDAVRFFLVRLGHGMTAQLLSYLWQGDRGLHYWYHCCPCSVSHHVFSVVLLLKLVLWWVGSHDSH